MYKQKTSQIFLICDVFILIFTIHVASTMRMGYKILLIGNIAETHVSAFVISYKNSFIL